MDSREVTEKRTTIKDTTVPAGQSTNVNVRPDGGANVQVNDPAVGLISADRKAIPTLGEALAAVEGVSEVYSVTGPMDFIAMVRAREHDELADIVTRRIGQVPGVVRTDTHVAFKMYSRHDLESLFSIGADQPAKRA